MIHCYAKRNNNRLHPHFFLNVEINRQSTMLNGFRVNDAPGWNPEGGLGASQTILDHRLFIYRGTRQLGVVQSTETQSLESPRKEMAS